MTSPADTITGSANRRCADLGDIAAQLDAHRSESSHRRRVMQQRTEGHLEALGAEVERVAKPLLDDLATLDDGGPLRVDEHADHRAGGARMQVLHASLAEERGALLSQDPAEAAGVVREAIAAGNLMPLLALEGAPAALRTKAQTILASWPPADLAAMRRTMRAALNPTAASHVAKLHGSLRDLAEAADQGAYAIGQHDPRMKAGDIHARDFIGALRTIEAVLPPLKWSAADS